MEVCGGANYWSRLFRAYGHDVRLMSPQFVKPYVKSNKNDCNDAEAICEAVSRPTMRFVAPKTVAQQDLQGLHRIRQRLVQSRTALINQTRGLLAEYGITVPQQAAQLRRRLPIVLDDPTNELTPLGRELFADLARELASLNERISQVEARITHLFAENETCQRLAQVEGVGPLIATAVVASVSDPRAFKNGRQLAAWLGLVPRQRSGGTHPTVIGNQQAGGPIPPHVADLWSTRRCRTRFCQAGQSEPLDHGDSASSRYESDVCRGGEQECAYPVGLDGEGRTVSTSCLTVWSSNCIFGGNPPETARVAAA